MHELFAPGEMAMNVCRTCVGSSDYARTLQLRRERPARSGAEEVLHRSRQGLHSAHAERGAQAESGPVSVLLAVEPAGMDEVQQVHAGRGHAQDQLRPYTRRYF